MSVASQCLTLGNPVDCSPPGFSVHGILQARVLEWVAIPFSRDYKAIVLQLNIKKRKERKQKYIGYRERSELNI